MLKNLHNIPMGDDFFGGIVNRKNAIEKRLDAQKKASAYGAEKKKPKKDFKDDRNEYETSRYGQIAYHGMGAEAAVAKAAVVAKIEKIKEVRAAKSVDMSKAQPKLTSNITLVTSATKKKIAKKRRFDRAYKGMGDDLGGFKETMSNIWGKIKSKIGMGDEIGDADFGDFNLGARKNIFKRAFRRKRVVTRMPPPLPKPLPASQVRQMKAATPAQRRAIMLAATPAERRQIKFSMMTPAQKGQVAARRRVAIRQRQMALRAPAPTSQISPAGAAARQQHIERSKFAAQQVTQPTVRSVIQPIRRSALQPAPQHKAMHKAHANKISHLAKSSIKRHGYITPPVRLLIEKLIAELKGKPTQVTVTKTTYFSGMGDDNFGATKKKKAAPAKKPFNVAALIKKGAAIAKQIAPKAQIVQPSGGAVSVPAPVVLAAPSLLTPKNMAIAGGVAATLLVAYMVVSKKHKKPAGA
jgi:hypothetical protein